MKYYKKNIIFLKNFIKTEKPIIKYALYYIKIGLYKNVL